MWKSSAQTLQPSMHLGKQSMALPLTSSSFSSVYFFSFAFSHLSLPFSHIPFIPFPLNMLFVHFLTVTHLCPLPPPPSFIFNSCLPHCLLMLRKQCGMGRMAAAWVPGCQSKLSLFLQRISGYLFPSCPQWSLGAREAQDAGFHLG